jgi:superfamily I DNA/RNA helicase
MAHRPGRRWSHLAVLARTNAQLTTVAQAFDKARIPYVLAGGELGPGSDVADGTPESPEGPAVTLAPAREPDQAHGGDDDGVVLTTFHRAKGLQWPVVFVIGLGDGLVPISWASTPDALDEERRLLYVALTRAEDELFCSWSLYRDARLAGTGWRPRRPSPWLAAIEQVGARLARAEDPPDPGSVTAHLSELRARLAPRGPDDR